jgi:hypothetical protein
VKPRSEGHEKMVEPNDRGKKKPDQPVDSKGKEKE